MREETFSSFKSFRQKVKAKNETLEQALKEYFALGGIIRVQIESSKQWPKLVYPSNSRLEYLIKEKQAQIENLKKQRASWSKRLQNANLYYLMHFFKKYSKPLYWKHIAKSLTDKDYRLDAQKVKIPVHLVADKRWEPMIRMFVESPEYRKQLCLTFEESPIYKKNKKLAKYSDQLLEFRKQESKRMIEEIDSKIAALEKEISVLRKLQRWAS